MSNVTTGGTKTEVTGTTKKGSSASTLALSTVALLVAVLAL